MSSFKSEYDFSAIESKWQSYWLTNKTFKTEDFSNKPKYYVLDMFPYPSGSGLHVGHVEGYTATDIVARYKRMKGFNVLHPMGWDAFGLPAEQYAIKTGTHPAITTENNINYFRKQIRSFGYAIDWDREINTTDPDYYRWSQWIFLQLYKKGLAYESFEAVNWCPALGTVLANEEVIDGRSEVGDHPVVKKPLRQWVLKITEYAERLLTDLDELDWPESTKEMQRNWIGKSVGAQVVFSVQGKKDCTFEVFTTCPHTLFGATFCVLAPEHPLIRKITTDQQKDEVDSYIEETLHKSEMDRTSIRDDKTGVFTGAFAINPVNKKPIPIFIADYVLMGYGTGAIMAVPGHDERDHAFAKKYSLAIVEVVKGSDKDISEAAYTGPGTMVNSSFLDGLDSQTAIQAICDWLEKEGCGKKTVTYKLRDWIFSRQRYWGEPFPLARDENGSVITIDESSLPVILPELDDYKPSGTGEPPLSKAKDWLTFKKDGVVYTRETNIMPQWAGSCWYYLRYLDPRNDSAMCDPKKEAHWLPVDLYVGGAEHANLHLLYARFWHKVLYDLGYVKSKEPFKKVVHQGLILGSNGEKMSKSRGNVVNPDDVIKEWGADSLRLFEMFMGPIDQVKPWNTSGIMGVHRFLKRIWRLIISEEGNISSALKSKIEGEDSLLKPLHKTIKKVTEDTESLRFNTAIATMMEFVNQVYKEGSWSKFHAETFALLLAPYAPHLAEEIWAILGHSQSLANEPWPSYDETLTLEETITLAVMVNGKHRGNLVIAKDASKDDIISSAKKLEGVERHLAGKTLKNEIFVPGKIINFVIN